MNPLANVLTELSSVEQLCLASNKKADELSGLLKKIYDFASSQGCKAGSIDELIVENVDAETIWEELNSRNTPLIRQLTSKITKINRSIDETVALANTEETDDESEQDEEVDNSVDEEEDEEQSENNEDSEVDDESDGGIPDHSDDDSGEEGEAKNNDGHSESDMEKWLDDMDDAEMRRNDADYVRIYIGLRLFSYFLV